MRGKQKYWVTPLLVITILGLGAVGVSTHTPSVQAITPSGAGLTTLANPDFNGPITVSGGGASVPGWTVTSGSIAHVPSGAFPFRYVQLTAGAQLQSESFTLDYPTGSSALFMVGYNAGAPVTVSYNGHTAATLPATPTVPPGYFAVTSFTVPSSAGVGPGSLSFTAGSSDQLSFDAVGRLDGAASQRTAAAGMAADPRFPKRVAPNVGGVDASTGNATLVATDLALDGFTGPLSWSRVYGNQADAKLAGIPLGAAAWNSSWDITLLDQTPVAAVLLMQGRPSTFPYTSGSQTYSTPAGIDASLTGNGTSGWTLTTAGQLRYAFTAGGVLASVADRNGNLITVTRDPTSGRATRLTAPSGRSLSIAYNQTTGLLSSLSDSAGRSVSYGYDSSTGDLTSVTDARGQITHYAYSDHLLTSITNPNGHTVLALGYDSHNRVQTEKDALNNQASFAYATPAAGATQVTDPRGKHWLAYFDTALRGTDLVDPLGHTTHVTYDSDNNLQSVTDPNNHTTSYTFDPSGNTKSATDAANKQWQFSYDSKNDLLSATDPNTHAQSFTYDTNGNLRTAADALTHTTTYTVNSKGQVTQRQDPRGNTTNYGYDVSTGDLTSLSGAITRSYSYDTAGHRTQMTDATGTTTYSYDANKVLLSSVSFPSSHSLSYGYDNAGNRSSITYPGNAHGVSFGYDQDERLSSVTDWNSQQTSYGYDAAGNLTSATLPSGTALSSTYAYDDAGRLQSITHKKGGTTVASAGYTLDSAGNRLTRATQAGTETYSYDALNRLTQAQYPGSGGTVGYGYDATGNRSSLTNPGSTGYSYDTADQLTTVTPPAPGSPTSYTFDPSGNLTARGADSFSWDAENHLTSATVGGTTTAMTYNGDGLRVTRGSTNYTWDVGRALPRLLDDGSYQYVYGLGSGPLARVALADGTTQYYLADGLGSTLALTDSSGASIQSYSYDAFGTATPANQTVQNEVTFAGQQTDPTGLQYLRARYYDPMIGRFISRDSFGGFAGQTQGLNRFAYTMGDPAGMADPTGYGCGFLSGVCDAAGAVAGAVGSAAGAVGGVLSNPGVPNALADAGLGIVATTFAGGVCIGVALAVPVGTAICGALAVAAVGYDVYLANDAYQGFQ